ncbi:MAG: hypothetical protein LBH28_07705 [Oscillospiraceae bacterium]|nr:hypothetical protein [Oscillospiraceae bacterium]
MSPDFIFYSGIVICGVAIVSAVIAVIILRLSKTRLNKRLDAEYGKRRH